jgi:hypothetical protein
MPEESSSTCAMPDKQTSSHVFKDLNKRKKRAYKNELKLKINDLCSYIEKAGLLSTPVKIWFDFLLNKFKIKNN